MRWEQALLRGIEKPKSGKELFMQSWFHFCAGTSIAVLIGLSDPQALAVDWPMFGRDVTRHAVSPEENAPTFYTSPIFANGALYIANRSYLFAIQQEKGVSKTPVSDPATEKTQTRRAHRFASVCDSRYQAR